MKKSLILTSLLATTLFTSSGVLAQESPNWNYIEAGYISPSFDDSDENDENITLDFGGYILGGSIEINDNFFAIVNYSDTTASIFGLDLGSYSLSIGAGYKYGLTEITDIFSIASFVNSGAEASFLGASESYTDNGYSLEAGIRSMLSEQFELTGSLDYTSISNSYDTTFNISAFYYFSPQLSFGGSYFVGADTTGFTITTRLLF